MRKFFLIAFIGPVGSGKTYIAKILPKNLGATRITTDDIRVKLRSQGKSYSSARRIAQKRVEKVLASGKPVLADFDMVLPQRRRKYQRLAQKYGARFIVIRVQTPPGLVLLRLRRKKYGKNELFRNAQEAIRVYFMRRKLHYRRSKIKADFLINNARTLAPQIKAAVKKLKGP